MKLKQIETTSPKIDSFSLWIQREKCSIINKRLTSSTVTYYTDIQEIDDVINPPKPIIIIANNSTIRVSLGHVFDKEYIVLTITAKLLGKKYFDGITKHNIKEIYEKFMSEKIFSCSWETFIKSKVIDIDFCINMYIKEKSSFNKIVTSLKRSSGSNIKYLNI